MRMRVFQCALVGLLLGGCALTPAPSVAANDYAEFYRADAGVTPNLVAQMRGDRPRTSSPDVVPVAKWDDNVASYYARKGYVRIGWSGFTSGNPESDEDAITVAIRLGADLVVILAPEYHETISANVPITVPTVTTSRTNGSATAYGSGSPVMAFGNSTTTTYGTSTRYVPMTVQRSVYGAVYLLKKHYLFGAQFRDLTDTERQQFETNRGARVSLVVDDSPAYNSDIIPGDVIVAVDGEAATGQQRLMELITENHGRTVEIAIIRSGKSISKEVTILE